MRDGVLEFGEFGASARQLSFGVVGHRSMIACSSTYVELLPMVALLGNWVLDPDADCVTARRRPVVVSQRHSLDRGLTIGQNLLMHGLCHGLSRTERRSRADGLLGGDGSRGPGRGRRSVSCRAAGSG
ncbi:hypothetical protein IQ63_45015 [Streptomyces acidiscabies]|uniref:Uncharacterized protein n=1 Tax=Streptomyces acidiscabies TaxID=42234 RepID=A0A0L0JDD9_9ACTN|nr:hypothetical protein IQ63_45015 [Streptomyces acidiscabies]